MSTSTRFWQSMWQDFWKRGPAAQKTLCVLLIFGNETAKTWVVMNDDFDHQKSDLQECEEEREEESERFI
jgi:hypothetical protein